MEFEILDAGDFYKLEKVGPYVFYRPSPASVWPKNTNIKEYKQIDARYDRYEKGKGEWVVLNKKLPKKFGLEVLGLTLEMQLTSFGHLGLFAEQFINWKRMQENIQKGDRVLNLFAYTGVASLVCAAQGAQVTHVDASKSSVAWARKNQELSNLQEASVRWIVDDVRKFSAREVRRENTYDWIVLDPPSFGRGPGKEPWIIEEHLSVLMQDLSRLKSKNFKGILLSSHSPGYTPQALDNVLVSSGFDLPVSLKEEMTVPHPKCPVPSGFCAWRVQKEL